MRSGRKSNKITAASLKKSLNTVKMSSLKKIRRLTSRSANTRSNSMYIKRHTFEEHQKILDNTQINISLANGYFETIFQQLAKNSAQSHEINIQPIEENIILLQKFFNEIIQHPTADLKEKFSKQREAIQNLLAANVNAIEDNTKKKISRYLRKLDNCIVFDTSFDDKRLRWVKKIINKSSGANAGYTITNAENTRFTVKKGKTIGNTLSEVFSSMVLTKMVQASGAEDDSKKLIANAFLVVDEAQSHHNLSLAKNCKARLFAASEWSSGRSFEACQLFGLKKRKKAAGSRQSKDFEDLRRLNAACGLGLENIVIPTSLIADFDLHTENFMLKIIEADVPDQYKKQVKAMIDTLFTASLVKPDKMTPEAREARLNNLIVIINTLKQCGAVIYFHKIDHDSGFYRYTHSDRTVDFLSHHTMPFHREGFLFKTQPTSHVAEITGSVKGLDQLLLSDNSIDGLLKMNLEIELKIVLQSAMDFFEMIHTKSNTLANKEEDKLATEFYLLNEFYHHITEKTLPTPENVNEHYIIELKTKIYTQLELGTKQKVQDLNIQLYQHLSNKVTNQQLLTPKQNELMKSLENHDYIKDIMREKLAKGFS